MSEKRSCNDCKRFPCMISMPMDFSDGCERYHDKNDDRTLSKTMGYNDKLFTIAKKNIFCCEHQIYIWNTFQFLIETQGIKINDRQVDNECEIWTIRDLFLNCTCGRKLLSFEDLKVGMKVYSRASNKEKENLYGIVTKCDDIHNVEVAYGEKDEDGNYDGYGLYCLDFDCEDYEPLYKKDKNE